ncbi:MULTISPECIES: hypothetical protein [Kitasatospora]
MTLRQLEALWGLALCGTAGLAWWLLESAVAGPKRDRAASGERRRP